MTCTPPAQATAPGGRVHSRTLRLAVVVDESLPIQPM
jgi:hypothetical protein